MNKISGIVLTHNNRRTISQCLESLKGLCSEIIIIDDFSGDNTLELIKNIYPGARIYQRKLERFDNQRNYGISLANNDWVLMIDSDEAISEELNESIMNHPEDKDIDAYWCFRSNQFFSATLQEKYINRPILFKKTLKFSYPVHEIIKINESRMAMIKGFLIHNNWVSIEKNMEKMNTYSSFIAQKWIEQKRNYSKGLLLILSIALPVRYFFICFFKKKFYKAGFFKGFFYSIFESSWWLAVIFKYQELKDKN